MLLQWTHRRASVCAGCIITGAPLSGDVKPMNSEQQQPKLSDNQSLQRSLNVAAVLVLCLCGCGIVPPKYRHNPEATISFTTNSQYRAVISSEVTTYGGLPDTLGIRFPMKERDTLAFYIIGDTIKGEIAARDLKIGLVGDSPHQYVKGSVAFNGDKMEVKLQFPHYHGRWRTPKYEPFELNGVYRIKMMLPSESSED
jgi:hypothetical protein